MKEKSMCKSGKRILAVFLCLIMMFGCFPNFMIQSSASSTVKSKLDTFISSYPSGSSWTGSFDGGSQCYGFAKMVIYNLFGKNGSSYRSWLYNGTPTNGMTAIGSITSYSASNVQSLLSKAKPGDVLQFNTTKQHSMIVYSVESDGVYIYDCNWDNNCGISFRKSSFGAWSGRNSSKLTLLRADNYPTVTHTVDSSYGTNFIAYPKEKITASNILDSDHNTVSSTAWIGTGDKCTINEVYTDGCCKVTYPLDDGGTKTVYVKYSLFRTPKLSVYYNANSGSISSDTYKLSSNVICLKSDSTKYYQTWTYNEAKANGLVNAGTFGLSRTGYKFAGWGTTSSGGTVFDPNDSTLKPSSINSNLKNGDCSSTLYAQWNENAFTVNYYSNYADKSFDSPLNAVGASKNVLVRTYAFPYSKQYDTGLHDYSSTSAATYLGRTGYTATGNWNTKADGTGISVSQKTSFTGQTMAKAFGKDLSNGNASINLYPEWKANTYTVKYNANGGTGTMASSSHTYNTAKALTANAFTRSGYTFKGWNTKADGTGTSYTDKQSVKNLTSTNGATINLYAQWTHTHSYTSKITKAATCCSTGVRTYTCSTCGDTYTETIAKDSTNHSGGTTVKNAVSATCSATGYTGDTYCNGCNAKIKSGTKISTIAHIEGNWIIDKAAQPGVEGSKHKECTVCHTVLETAKIPALPASGHSITLDKDSIDLDYKSSAKINVEATGNVIWTSSNPNVVSVDGNGNIRALKEGTAIITATIEGTNISASCKINVNYTWLQWIIIIVLFGWIWYI